MSELSRSLLVLCAQAPSSLDSETDDIGSVADYPNADFRYYFIGERDGILKVKNRLDALYLMRA